jgi:hypothetical protein
MSTDMVRPELELFNDSLARCLRGDRFFQRFYELFVASSPEVRDKFRTSDFRKQQQDAADFVLHARGIHSFGLAGM